jgi:hypothetical protein
VGRMSKYTLGKPQIKRLLEGKHVMDGHGRKFIAGDNIKEVLQTLDSYNLYDKFEVYIENGKFDMRKKVE